MVNELPEDTNWEELMYKIYVRQSIEEGLQDSEEGNTTPHEEIKKNISLPHEDYLDSKKGAAIRSNI